MDTGLAARALSAWKAADEALMDAEGLLRIQVLKYAEGVSGPPSLDLLEQVEELQVLSRAALLAAMKLLSSVGGLRHLDEPHSGFADM